MGNISKKIFGSIVFAAVLFCGAKVAMTGLTTDEKCEALPSCEALGYTNDATKLDCNEKQQIRCPYNASYSKCVNAGCEALGFTVDDKTSWCREEKIKYCPTDENYSLCEEACGLCKEGETNPICPYGMEQITDENGEKLENNCKQPCYRCKVCEEDKNSGYLEGKDKCDDDEYVVSVVNPSCPENLGGATKYVCNTCPKGMIPDGDMVDSISGVSNKQSCKCDEERGYYAKCPTGAECERVDTESGFSECYQASNKDDDDGCTDGDNGQRGYVKYVSSNMDSHFNYGSRFQFILGNDQIDNAYVQHECIEVIGCNENTEGSVKSENANFDEYFATETKTLGSTTCVWVSGCNINNENIKNIREDKCSSGRVFTNAKDSNNGKKVGHTCGTCECDTERGYYASEPDGRISTSNTIDGKKCFIANACDETNNWTATWEDKHFTYSEDDGLLPACRKVKGCNGNLDASQSEDHNTTYFSVVEVTNAGMTCQYVNGCAAGKVDTCDASKGLKWKDKKTVDKINLTCGTCECDNSKGYYDTCPEGAVCTQIGTCYRAEADTCHKEWVKGTRQETAQGVTFTYGTDSHFKYSVAKEFTGADGKRVGCKKVTGCNTKHSGTDDATSLDAVHYEIVSKTEGTTTCYWYKGCKYVAANGSCGDGYQIGDCAAGQKSTENGSLKCCLCGATACADNTSLYKTEKLSYQCVEAGKSGDLQCYSCACKDNYCGDGCNTKISSCGNKYKFVKVPNAKMGGKCETISQNTDKSCSYDGVKYDSFACTSGFKEKKDNQGNLIQTETDDGVVGCDPLTCADYNLNASVSTNKDQTSVGYIEKLGNTFGMCYQYKNAECKDFNLVTATEMAGFSSDIKAKCNQINPTGSSSLVCYDCPNTNSSKCYDSGVQKNLKTCDAKYKYSSVPNAVLTNPCDNVSKRGGDLCKVDRVYETFTCVDGWQTQKDSAGNPVGCEPITCEQQTEVLDDGTTVHLSETPCDLDGWEICKQKKIACGNSQCECYYGKLKTCSSYGEGDDKYYNQCVEGFKCEEHSVTIGNETRTCYQKGVESVCEDYGYLDTEDTSNGKKCTTISGLASGADGEGHTLYGLTCYSCGYCANNQCTKTGGTTCGQALGTAWKDANNNVLYYYQPSTANCGDSSKGWRTAETAIENGKVNTSGTSCTNTKKGADDICQTDIYYNQITCNTCYEEKTSGKCTAKTCPENTKTMEEWVKVADYQRYVLTPQNVTDAGTTCLTCYSKGDCNEAGGYYSFELGATTLKQKLGVGRHLKIEGENTCLKVETDTAKACRACYKWNGAGCVAKTCEDINPNVLHTHNEGNNCYKYVAASTNVVKDKGYTVFGASGVDKLCYSETQLQCFIKECNEEQGFYEDELDCNLNAIRNGYKSCRQGVSADGCNDTNVQCWTYDESNPITCGDLGVIRTGGVLQETPKYFLIGVYDVLDSADLYPEGFVANSTDLTNKGYGVMEVPIPLGFMPNEIVGFTDGSSYYPECTINYCSGSGKVFVDGQCVAAPDPQACATNYVNSSATNIGVEGMRQSMTTRNNAYNGCVGGVIVGSSDENSYQRRAMCFCEDDEDGIMLRSCNSLNEINPNFKLKLTCYLPTGCNTSAGYYETSDDCLYNNRGVYGCKLVEGSNCWTHDVNKKVDCSAAHQNKYAPHGAFVHETCGATADDKVGFRCTSSYSKKFKSLNASNVETDITCWKWEGKTCDGDYSLYTPTQKSNAEYCYNWTKQTKIGGNNSTGKKNENMECWHRGDIRTCANRSGAYDTDTACKKGNGSSSDQHNCCEQGKSGCSGVQEYAPCTSVQKCYATDPNYKCNYSNGYYLYNTWNTSAYNQITQNQRKTCVYQDYYQYANDDESFCDTLSYSHSCEEFTFTSYTMDLVAEHGISILQAAFEQCAGGALYFTDRGITCDCSGRTATDDEIEDFKKKYCPPYHSCNKIGSDDCYHDDGCNIDEKAYDTEAACKEGGSTCEKVGMSGHECWQRKGCGKGYHPSSSGCVPNTCDAYSQTTGGSTKTEPNGHYGSCAADWWFASGLQNYGAKCEDYTIDVPAGTQLYYADNVPVTYTWHIKPTGGIMWAPGKDYAVYGGKPFYVPFRLWYSEYDDDYWYDPLIPYGYWWFDDREFPLPPYGYMCLLEDVVSQTEMNNMTDANGDGWMIDDYPLPDYPACDHGDGISGEYCQIIWKYSSQPRVFKTMQTAKGSKQDCHTIVPRTDTANWNCANLKCVYDKENKRCIVDDRCYMTTMNYLKDIDTNGKAIRSTDYDGWVYYWDMPVPTEECKTHSNFTSTKPDDSTLGEHEAYIPITIQRTLYEEAPTDTCDDCPPCYYHANYDCSTEPCGEQYKYLNRDDNTVSGESCTSVNANEECETRWTYCTCNGDGIMTWPECTCKPKHYLEITTSVSIGSYEHNGWDGYCVFSNLTGITASCTSDEDGVSVSISPSIGGGGTITCNGSSVSLYSNTYKGCSNNRSCTITYSIGWVKHGSTQISGNIYASTSTTSSVDQTRTSVGTYLSTSITSIRTCPITNGGRTIYVYWYE